MRERLDRLYIDDQYIVSRLQKIDDNEGRQTDRQTNRQTDKQTETEQNSRFDRDFDVSKEYCAVENY